MIKSLILLDLKFCQIEWYEDNGKIYSIEKWIGDEDVVEVELGEVSEDQIIEDVINRIEEELKLPKSILGTIKAKIKQIKLPLTIKLIEEDKVNKLKFNGSKGNFELIITYKIV